MASGYRNVVHDGYAGVYDDVVTAPSSSVSDAGGMWVTANLFRAALPCMFSPIDTDDRPRISVVEVTWDAGDVLETKHTGSTIVAGGTPGVPDPPVEFVGYRVSAVDVGAELTYDEIRLAANDPSQQE